MQKSIYVQPLYCKFTLVYIFLDSIKISQLPKGSLIFMLFLVDSRKHWLHCQNMCSISCWTTLSWGEFCFLIQQLFTFDNMIVFYFHVCCKLLVLSFANRKEQQFVQILLCNTAITAALLFDNILYLIVYSGTISIRPNSATLLCYYSRYLKTLRNTNYCLCIPLSFQPLGYKVDDTKLKRAGLDYWPYPWIYHICFFNIEIFISFGFLVLIQKNFSTMQGSTRIKTVQQKPKTYDPLNQTEQH